MPQVYKFGGASIQDADAFRRLGTLLAEGVERPRALVVSAMGKTTNALEALLAAAREQDEADYRQRLTAIRDDHLAVAEALFGPDSRVAAELSRLVDELDAAHAAHRQASYPFHYDQTVGFGELLSTTLLAAWLNAQGVATRWCDARELIVTDDRHQAARINWSATRARITGAAARDEALLLTQGFIGATPAGAMTTLGREGSDFSAAILAEALAAEGLTIWKDVPGLFNADPRRFPNARQIRRISYAEALEQTWHGAKVIHPRTLAPLQRAGIPLTVRSFLEPEVPPSTIGPEPGDGDHQPALILRDEQVLLEVSDREGGFIEAGLMADALNALAEQGLNANLLEVEAQRLRLVVNRQEERLAPLLERLNACGAVSHREDLALLTVRHPGEGLMAALDAGRTPLVARQSGATAQRLYPAAECPERWQIPEP
ncbi:aspartate kinase [Halomonas sp. BM-2019]|uniref:aspartate kinase n=1 Tax=Halomonas sp. BM-2019 TaxID=2811227 RepID=UPI001B3C3611|nr:MAG: aspartate kinase [Halomonas sp. BM-2019]